MTKLRHASLRRTVALFRDEDGSALIETAIALPILSVLLSGIVSYAMYFMSAHSLQSAANEGARASIAGLTASEREDLVTKAIGQSLAQATLVKAASVKTTTSAGGAYYTVKLSYDAKDHVVFKAALVPMPNPTIERFAVVELPTY